MSFSVISQIVLFWWGSKMSLSDNLAPKSAHPTNTIKIGVSAKHCFEKQMCVTKRPCLDPKKPKTRNSSFIFCLSWLPTTKNKHLLKPLILQCLSKHLKQIFQKLNLKQRNLENICTHLLKKAILKKWAVNWAQKKTHTHKIIIENNWLETTINTCRKSPWIR